MALRPYYLKEKKKKKKKKQSRGIASVYKTFYRTFLATEPIHPVRHGRRRFISRMRCKLFKLLLVLTYHEVLKKVIRFHVSVNLSFTETQEI